MGWMEAIPTSDLLYSIKSESCSILHKHHWFQASVV
ncbi:hypothetical protein DES53_105153 [Roseimicrobium gellanilyticum]|uniref:Uncharacterized protein n=1 Tax=Roseimicrobium gellanilyticum TaxID=748857 RepID=A0A366HLL1_9BACT|nr:hypothetical protein DES53_105153 [Roseimicrobium gellanilyticum]